MVEIRTVNVAKAASYAVMIAEEMEKSPLSGPCSRQMIQVLNEWNDGDKCLSNGELMEVAACVVAAIVHRNMEVGGSPLTREEMGVAIGMAAGYIEVQLLN